MRTTIRLRNVVGEAQYLLGVRVVPLHCDFNTNRTTTRQLRLATRIKHCRVQDSFCTVDVLDETLDAPGKSKIFFFAGPLVDQLYLDAVIKERQFTEPLGKNVIVKFDGADTKDFFISQKMDFCASILGVTENF